MRIVVYLILLGCCLGKSEPLLSQTALVQDSLNQRLQVLGQLVQANNLEQSAVETEGLRDFLKRHRLPASPRAVALVSGVYFANKNENSATRFLSEAEVDARRDLNPGTRKALLETLAKEYKRWGLDEQALTCQSLALIAQDSFLARQRRSHTMAMQRQVDSLLALRQMDVAGEGKYLRIEKDRAYLLGAALALLLLGLLFAHYKNTDHWRKVLEKRELEFELTKANLQQFAEEKAVQDTVAAVQAVQQESQKAPTPPPADPFGGYPGEKPDLIALVIEPNRQIVLYLKSLLSDRFQVETASTPNEGLHMATQLLPDLVVCDVILNGTTGIEVARKIKLSERTNHVPVVLLTDKFGNEGKLDALRAGADAWFTRPVLDDEFDTSVKKLLDGRKVKHEQFSRFLQLYFTDARIPADNPFIQQTVLFIEHNLSDPNYMADDMARKMQMTKPHFTKKLRVLTGKEPVQLIRELRLEKAKILLEKRAGTPQAISELVGFTNPGTFAMAFKDYFGENTSLLYSVPPRLGQ